MLAQHEISLMLFKQSLSNDGLDFNKCTTNGLGFKVDKGLIYTDVGCICQLADLTVKAGME